MSALLTSAQRAMARTPLRYGPNEIPPITDPLGKHWHQPKRDGIAIDAEVAVMTRADFDLLAEYSCSTPTGVYPGKMWKRHQPYERPESCHPLPGRAVCGHWWLCWFGYATDGDPKYCSNHYRKLLVA